MTDVERRDVPQAEAWTHVRISHQNKCPFFGLFSCVRYVRLNFDERKREGCEIAAGRTMDSRLECRTKISVHSLVFLLAVGDFLVTRDGRMGDGSRKPT